MTGPDDGIPGPRRTAALAVSPHFTGPLGDGAHLASDVAPFERVRLVLRRTDGTVAKDTIVPFPSNVDAIELTLSITLPLTAGDDGVPLSLTMRYINAAGDTVFSGGPVTVQAVPTAAGESPTPVDVPVIFVGTGATAASVTLSPASGTTVVSGTTTQFSAVARDLGNVVLPNTPVLYTSPDAASVTVTSSGLATWLPVRGTARVIGTLLTNAAADTVLVTVTLPASQLLAVGGDAQSGPANAALADPLVLRVAASDGVGVAGHEVTFAVTTGAGVLSALKDTSDADGLVSTNWTLGAPLGAQSVTATVTGIAGATRVLTATAVTGAPVRLEITGEPTGPQTAGAALAPALVARAVDAGGNTVTAFTGEVTVALAANPTATTLAGTTTRAATAGVVAFDDLVLSAVASGYTLEVTSGGLLPDTTSAVDVGSAAASILTALSGDGQAGVVGSALAAPFRVRVTDAFANPIAGVVVSWTITAGGGALGAPTSVTDAAGEATATLTLPATAGAVSVTASVAGLTGSPQLFAATAQPGPATQLVFTQQVASATATVPMASGWTVVARDALGNTVPGYTGPVSITLSGGDPLAVLGGTTSRALVGGTATFDDLAVDRPGSGYTLTAAGPGVGSAVSAPFTVGTAVIQWINIAGGTWSTPANWDLGRVPMAGDSVVIAASGTYTVTMDVNATVGWIQLGGAGGTTTLVANSRTIDAVNGVVVTTSGVMSMASTTISGPVANAGALIVAGLGNAVGGLLTNAATGTLTIGATPEVTANAVLAASAGLSNGGSIVLTNSLGVGFFRDATLTVTGGPLVNLPGGVMTAEVGTSSGGARTITATLDNQGTLTATTALALTLSGSSQNTGLIDIVAGASTLTQAGGATFLQTGAVTIAAGQSLTVSGGGMTLGSASVLDGAGTIALNATAVTLVAGQSRSAGTLTLNGTTVGGAGALSNPLGATLEFTGNVTTSVPVDNAGTFTVAGSANAVGGLLTNAATGTLTIGATLEVTANAVLAASAGLSNGGSIVLTNNLGVGFFRDATLTVTGGPLVNLPGGLVTAEVGTSSGGARTITATLDNQGTLTATTALALTLSGSSQNTGLVDIVAGATTLTQAGGASFLQGGTVTVAAGQSLAISGGSVTLGAASVLDGAGTIALNATAVTLVAGQSRSAGTLTLSAATIGGTGALSNPLGATLAFTGNVTTSVPVDNAGAFTVAGSANAVGGLLTNTATGTLTIGATPEVTANAVLAASAGLSNGGSIVLANNLGVGFFRDATLTVTGGPLVNLPGGVMTAEVGTSSGGARTLAATLDNQGTLDLYPSTTGTLSFTGDLTNSGTITADIGPGGAVDLLAVTGSVTLGGTLDASLVGGYVPPNGSTFTFLTHSGTRTGTFTTVTVPAELSSSPSYLANSIALNAAIGAGVRLGAGTQPVGVNAGDTAPLHSVTVRDGAGSIVTTATGTVTVSVDSGPAAATILGTTTVPIASGVAEFTTNQFTVAGDYRLRYTSSGLADTVSAIFTVAPAAPNTLVILSGNGQSVPAFQPAPDSLRVRLVDGFGNGIPGTTVNFIVTAGDPIASPVSVLTNATGVAATALTMGETVGAYTVEATSGGVSNAVFSGTTLATVANMVWTGNVSSSIGDPANWLSNTVPISADSILVPAGRPNYPVLPSNIQVAWATIEPGATVTVGNFFLGLTRGLITPATPSILADTGGIIISGPTGTVRGRMPKLYLLNGEFVNDGPLVVDSSLISADNATMSFGASAVTIGLDLITTSGGRIAMGAGSSVSVGRNALFDGGNTSGLLTGGTLSVAGNFVTTGTGDAAAFSAGPGHVVELVGTTDQGVQLAFPDVTPTATCSASCFGTLRALKAAGQGLVGFLTDLKAVTALEVTGDGLNANGRTILGGGTPNLSASAVLAAKIGWQTGLVRGATFAVDTLIAWGNNQDLIAGETIPTIVTGGVYRTNGSHPAPLVIGGFGGQLDVVGAATIGTGVGTALTTRDDGRVNMLEAADSLVVNGGAVFTGVTGPGLLAAGVMEVNGNFTQGIGGVTSYSALASHRLRILGANRILGITNVVDNPIGTLDLSGTSAVSFVTGARITGDVTIGPSVSVVGGGAPISLGGSLFDAVGSRWQVPFTTFTAADPAIPASILGDVTFEAGVVLDADFTLTGAFSVSGGLLDLNGNRLTVNGDFVSLGTGVVRMASAADTLFVSGAATFGGASTAGQLTAGWFEVQGNFAATAAESFSASGTHEAWFTGPGNQLLQFTNSGFGAGFQHFANLGIAQTGPAQVILESPVHVEGVVRSAPAASRHFAAATLRAVQARGADLTGVRFENVSLSLTDGAPITTLDSLSFTDHTPTAIQLLITRSNGSFSLTNPVFSTIPTTGAYLVVQDPSGAGDGVPSVAVTNPTPPFHNGFVFGNVTGWPDFAALSWTGAVSSDWGVAGNWSANRVPTATDSVFIGAGVTTMPIVTVQPTIRALVNENANPVQMTGGNWLFVTERLVLRNDAVGLTCDGGSVDMTHPVPAGPGTIQGITTCNLTTAQGELTLTDSVRVNANAVSVSGSARVVLGGRTLTTTGVLFMSGGGSFVMTNAADTITAQDASFGNSGSSGLYTDGVLRLSGFLTQSGGTDGYAPSANHRTILEPGVTDTVNVSFSAPASSRFQHLEVRRPVRLQTPATVVTDVRVETGGAIVGPGRLVVGADLFGRPGTVVAPTAVEIAGILSDTGTFSPDTTILTGSGQALPFTIGTPFYRSIRVTGTAQALPIPSPVTIDGDLIVEGTLTFDDVINAADLDIQGDLRVVGSGRLLSQNQPHQFRVRRHALFDGAASTGDLAAGTLRVHGDFTQLATTSAASFAPATAFTVSFDSTGTTSFADTTSSFLPILRFGAATIIRTHATDVRVAGAIHVDAGGVTVRSNVLGAGGTRRLVATGFDQPFSMALRNVTLRVTDGFPLLSTAQLTLGDFDPAAIQLDLARGGGSFTLTNPVFETAPGGAGRYLLVADSDIPNADPFTVIVTGASPTFHSGFAEALSPAVITGWAANPEFNWAGSVSSDWTDPANWSAGLVPASTDSVFVPAGTPFNPVIPAGASLRALVSVSASDVTAAGSVTITQRLRLPTAQGLVCSIGTLTFNPATAAEVSGRIEGCLVRQLTGTLTALDTVLVIGADVQVESSSVLDIGSTLVSVDGNFSTMTGGRLRMVQDSAHLLVLNGATFDGAALPADVTAGLLEVHGNFTQGGTASFIAGTPHVTRFFDNASGDLGARSIAIADTVSTFFGHVEVAQFARSVDSRLRAQGTIRVASGASLLGTGAIVAVDSIIVPSGAALSLAEVQGAGAFDVQGSFAADSLLFTGSGQLIPNAGVPLTRVIVTGFATFVSSAGANVTVTGDLVVRGGGILRVGLPDSTTSFTVNGTFRTEDSGILRMLDPNTRLIVVGDAAFLGGATNQQMSAGELELRGNFVQGGSPSAFDPNGTHVTLFAGSADQTVSFANPGVDFGTSHFFHLRLGQAGSTFSVQLLSDVFANGQLRNGDGTLRRFSASTPRTLTTTGADLSGFQFQNVRWQLRDGTAIGTIANVSFSAMDVAHPSYLDVERGTGTVTLTGTSFGSTPSGGGVYVRAADSNGAGDGLLVVDMQGTSPTAHDGLIALVNGATIIGWSATPPAQAIVWTGLGGNDNWNNTANWDLGRLPIATDSVVIDGVGSPYTVNLNANATVGWLVVGTNGAMTLNHAFSTTLQVDTLMYMPAGADLVMTSGATITGAGSMLLGGTFTWSGGTLAGSGGTLIMPGGTASLAATNTITLNERILSIGGTATVGSAGFTPVNAPAVQVQSGGLLDFQAPNSLFPNATTATIANDGTLRIGAAGNTVRIDWQIVNTGNIEVLSGTLDLRHALTHVGGTVSIAGAATLVSAGNTDATGAFAIAENGTMTLQSGGISADAGNHIFGPGSSITGLGTVRVNSADTTRFQGTLDIDSLTVQNGNTWFESADTMFVTNGSYLGGGFFRGSGTLALRGAFVLNAGNIVGTGGTMNVRPGASLGLRGMSGWTVDVEGTAVWGDYDMTFTHDTLNGVPYAGLRVRSGGVLDVQHGITTPRELFALGSATYPNVVFTIDAGGTVRKSTGTGVSNFRNRFVFGGTFDLLAPAPGSINVQGTCAMSGSIIGTGVLSGNCGAFP